MKRIETIVQPDKIGPLTYFLRSTAYSGLMITKIQGQGHQRPGAEPFRMMHFQDTLLPKLKLEIVAADQEVPKIIKKIKEICYSWKVGEGKIFISNVLNVIRIRTMEQGNDALL